MNTTPETRSASLAARAVELTKADEAEAMAAGGTSALTRFADNRIHQNVAETDIADLGASGRRHAASAWRRPTAPTTTSLAACCDAAPPSGQGRPGGPRLPRPPGPATLETPTGRQRPRSDFDARGERGGGRARSSTSRSSRQLLGSRHCEHLGPDDRDRQLPGVDAAMSAATRSGHGAVRRQERRLRMGLLRIQRCLGARCRRRWVMSAANIAERSARTPVTWSRASTPSCSLPRRSQTSWASLPTSASRPRPSPRSARS